MSEHVALKAEDGHQLDAYVARPAREPIAGLVVVQEVFGVNAHIRSVADGYAKDGFLAVAPAIFDRLERGVELKYEGEDMQKAMGLAKRLKMDDLLKDTSAAIEYARNETGKKTGVIGYCLGGSIAWLAACRMKIDAAVGYYGGYIAQHASEQPKCPVMLHFGKQDAHISPENVEKIRKAHPEIPIFLYDAGHGFNCDARASYDAPSAKLAGERSLSFLKQNLS
ncbi:MAG TPA: dienelactone hydrolase family protein [Silvibacterium sp.]|nr:dienelactone hydrolase family protein [Silvibacterium sp.]